MLVLSRKNEETIQLPELGIEIQILNLWGSSVSVGIEAPRHIRILRGELIQGDSLESVSSQDEVKDAST